MIVLRLVRGVVALVALAGLVAGVPAALWSLGSRFLPERLPTVDDVVVALTRPDDGSLLLGLLVVAGWIVWLQLTYSILVETTAQVRSRPQLRPDRSGYGRPGRSPPCSSAGSSRWPRRRPPHRPLAPSRRAPPTFPLPPRRRSRHPRPDRSTSSRRGTRCGTSRLACWGIRCGGARSFTSTTGACRPTVAG